ncbi:MAG: ATP-binding protein [Rubrivivax sp.]|nr:MAG: ATP-binding protein [Rubrivivax sp.]
MSLTHRTSDRPLGKLNYTRHIRRLRCISLRGLVAENDSADPPVFDASRDLILGPVNLFAGPNGSGKSTVLDAVRSLFEPELLAKLRRENIKRDVTSGFRVVFDSQSEVRAVFGQTGDVLDPSRQSDWSWQRTLLLVEVVDVAGEPWFRVPAIGSLPVVGEIEPHWLQVFKDALARLGALGNAWPRGATAVPDPGSYVEILRRFSHLLPRNASSGPTEDWMKDRSGKLSKINGRLHQYHGDDLTQSSAVDLGLIPSGWHQVVDLLSWVEQCEDHSICTIDEPERHLHPVLQRALISELAALRRRKNLQFIIATHSPTFLNRSAWNQTELAIFHMIGGRPVLEPRVERVLDQLGCLASDLCQSNGVIWVEGPSDRIYLNAFLRAWRSQRLKSSAVLTENVHYSFSFYQGSCLSHYSGTAWGSSLDDTDGPDDDSSVSSAEEQEDVRELIDLLALNRNAAICMDQDCDFTVDCFGDLVPATKLGHNKMRVIDELRGAANPVVHITSGYTIEAYVSQLMPKKFLSYVNGRAVVGGNKVQQAIRFAKKSDAEIASCFAQHFALELFIKRLHEAIVRWNLSAA